MEKSSRLKNITIGCLASVFAIGCGERKSDSKLTDVSVNDVSEEFNRDFFKFGPSVLKTVDPLN